MMVPPGKSWRELAADLARQLTAAQDRVEELERLRDENRARWLEAERERFEAHAVPRLFTITRKTCECREPACGFDYAERDTQRAWLAWQAAVGLK